MLLRCSLDADAFGASDWEERCTDQLHHFYYGDVRQNGEPLVCGTSVSQFDSDASHLFNYPPCETLQELNRQAWGILTSINMPERVMKRVRMVTFVKGRCESSHSSKWQYKKLMYFRILISPNLSKMYPWLVYNLSDFIFQAIKL